jgi:hypothetical protein
LCQLIGGFKPPLPPRIVDILKAYSSSGSIHDIPLVELIQKVAQEYGIVTFILDAMDECRDRSDILPKLQWLSGCMCLFVSGRDEEDIGASFREYCRCKLTIAVDDTHADIERFVAATLENHILDNPIFVSRTNLVDEIMRTVVGRANGM